MPASCGMVALVISRPKRGRELSTRMISVASSLTSGKPAPSSSRNRASRSDARAIRSTPASVATPSTSTPAHERKLCACSGPRPSNPVAWAARGPMTDTMTHSPVALDVALAVEQCGVAPLAGGKPLQIVGQLPLEVLDRVGATHVRHAALADDESGLLPQGSVLPVQLNRRRRFHPTDCRNPGPSPNVPEWALWATFRDVRAAL